jgi:hypothetical protein
MPHARLLPKPRQAAWRHPPNPQGVDNVYTQHDPLLASTLATLRDGSLGTQSYPYMGTTVCMASGCAAGGGRAVGQQSTNAGNQVSCTRLCWLAQPRGIACNALTGPRCHVAWMACACRTSRWHGRRRTRRGRPARPLFSSWVAPPTRRPRRWRSGTRSRAAVAVAAVGARLGLAGSAAHLQCPCAPY